MEGKGQTRAPEVTVMHLQLGVRLPAVYIHHGGVETPLWWSSRFGQQRVILLKAGHNFYKENNPHNTVDCGIQYFYFLISWDPCLNKCPPWWICTSLRKQFRDAKYCDAVSLNLLITSNQTPRQGETHWNGDCGALHKVLCLVAYHLLRSFWL